MGRTCLIHGATLYRSISPRPSNEPDRAATESTIQYAAPKDLVDVANSH